MPHYNTQNTTVLTVERKEYRVEYCPPTQRPKFQLLPTLAAMHSFYLILLEHLSRNKLFRWPGVVIRMRNLSQGLDLQFQGLSESWRLAEGNCTLGWTLRVLGLALPFFVLCVLLITLVKNKTTATFLSQC